MSEALALRFADALERDPSDITGHKAAAELRRLHALNAELVESLRGLEWAASGVEYMESEYANELSKARAALAKIGNAAIRSRT